MVEQRARPWTVTKGSFQVEGEDLATTMASVASDLQDAGGEEPTVQLVVDRAVELVPAASAASVMVHRSRRGYSSLAASSVVAQTADDLQCSLGEGPCLEVATETLDAVRAGDVASDQRWPRWGPQAAAAGVGSVLSVPLFSHGRRVGALNLYADRVGAFSTRDVVDLALVYAVHAAYALAAAQVVGNLEVALSSRHVIGVAQGILVERYGLDLQQSFALLTRISGSTETKLAEVAAGIVATGEVPTLGDG